MKLHLEVDGKVLDYELRPMRSSRFRALCQLAAGGLYVSLVKVAATLCGLPGVIAVGVCTVIITAVRMMDI